MLLRLLLLAVVDCILCKLVLAKLHNIKSSIDPVHAIFKRQMYMPSCGCVPRYVNPCINGGPILAPNGQPAFCHWQEPSCPGSYFCHVGAHPQTTCCCPKVSPNPCEQPLTLGQGTARLQRYYFDRVSQQCKPFIYLGLAGNENNFLTLEHCKRQCNVRAPQKNPCLFGLPAQTTQGENLLCSAVSIDTSCPGGFWCHVGATLDTTVCCQGDGQACTAPMSEGQGTAALQRFWFNPQSHECQPFTYRGEKGNQNNFLSIQSCSQTCPVWINPCVYPVTRNQVATCAPSPVSQCSAGSWCHIGEQGKDTTVCCPNAVPSEQICNLPVDAGIGKASLLRWYYDPSTRTCQQFQYRGLKGNQNSFLTQASCAQACPTWINVCPTGSQPLIRANQPQYCSPQSRCPSNFWCHVGSDSSTTMCCSSMGNPCTMSRSEGDGNTGLPRFYYDRNTHQCLPFSYRGIRGNQNNFLSKTDCEAVCPVYPNPCPSPSPLLDSNGAPVRCSATGLQSCPSTYWCHPGVTIATTMCCPGPCDPCTSQMNQGQPDTLGQPQQRWYFSNGAGRCQQFTYQGMKGNCNNFQTRDACRTSCPERNPCMPPGEPLTQGDQLVQCSPSNQNSCPNSHFCHPGGDASTTVCCPRNGNPCTQPRRDGSGNSQLQRWYYSTVLDECLPFSYKGMQGNSNNFISQAICQNTCPGLRGYCPHGKPLLVGSEPQVCSVETFCQPSYLCHVNTAKSLSLCCPDPTAFCYLPVDVGSCTDSMTRFRYNPPTDTCIPFTWSGCGGNLNNFGTLEDCTKICCNEKNRTVTYTGPGSQQNFGSFNGNGKRLRFN